MFTENYGLHRAVLDGRKTATRRIVDGYGQAYKAGETVAVAQSYKEILKELYAMPGERHKFKEKLMKLYHTQDWDDITQEPAMKNKMYVKSEAMIHHILIKDVRTEKLQAIDEFDAMDEGVLYNVHEDVYYLDLDSKHNFKDHKEAFAFLMDKVAKRGAWEDNPDVYVYTFKLID